MFPIAPTLSLVPADEEVFKQIAEELERNIFKCECWPVEQLEQVDVLLLVQCHSRRYILCAESRVALVDYIFEVCSWYFRGRDVERKDLICEVLKREMLPVGGPVAGEGRYFLGDEESAIGGKTFQHDILEGELQKSARVNWDVCLAAIHRRILHGYSDSVAMRCVKTYCDSSISMGKAKKATKEPHGACVASNLRSVIGAGRQDRWPAFVGMLACTPAVLNVPGMSPPLRAHPSPKILRCQAAESRLARASHRLYISPPSTNLSSSCRLVSFRLAQSF